jgi:putative transposase
MIEPEHPLSITRQCALLGLSRSSVYYQPAPAPAQELVLMRRLDELHLEHPWMGSRSLRDQLQRDGHPVGRDRVRRLMRRMGLHAVYRRPRTTIPDPLLSHLGGPQPQRHLGIGWILFSTAKEIGQGFALKQAQLHQA